MKKVFNVFKKRWYVFLIILLIGGFYLYNRQSVAAKKEQESLYTIKRQDLRELLSLSGEIAADEHVILRFQTSGRLSWIGVKEGDIVKKYQGIAALDQRDLQKRMQKTLNDYAKERNDFDQSKDDNQRVGDQPIREEGDAMKRLLEKAQYDLTNSVLDVELQQLVKEYSYLYTPIEGIVIRIDSKYPGINITPTGAEFEILNPSTLYYSFTADQTEVVKLKEGQRGVLAFDSYPEKEQSGEIYYLSYTPKSGETGTVYEGRMKLLNGDLMDYRYGMTGDVTFTLEEKHNVVSVPSSYVLSDTKGKYVEKKEAGKKIKTYIKVGSEIDTMYEVLKGLSEGDEIYIATSK
ncbi:hypothetical protein A2334_04215 [Candidatus Roizmanbacteria bacterium RIFOXYB2_FULL_38_10]|uniref:Uncharacterized protein n=1 Tax=Candidatus Roizmanbacteria bacterium RIFOXYD1_FULL_38_12 TaxID=1802093 RepID=A0A1F7KZD0_9BACT|nr:MAG: hypothetical protein A3K47_00325 [Candidatus Roizmanbacteria bacterium RIFOXYA2_FULL_38_14]OGK63247.1 MAG: hypothetical protein A3K27_00325 [Candidatus Roizmanbacteria bacterium RIFOXYA1_FULL_37_12]OGK65093.1 MAG: hypothetical protein A3K38_00325 [Candidatus Roizmanbacteria bacterium RIFOXYB1_FULL_40_23]OGK68647.1 MAG: hypothetical protein A2334_04215 [Candidatus Roizmanbacteria bacterium RIFOXYB2_FULL_38_10]OGK69497.1 MAG: hypothetical protein A3K21_00325 [Candidatus Roizmanbacteria ba